MAEYLNTNYKNITEYPNTFKRQGAFPLEMYSVFDSPTAANDYLTDPLAYEGQIIAVHENDSITVYVIVVDEAEDGELSFAYKEVGTETDLSDYYTRNETDSAIATAVAGAAHLKREIVDSTDNIDLTADDADQYVYMIPTGLTDSDNKYKEYMVINGEIEQVGNWEVDLSGYATKAEVDLKVDKVDGSRLMTNAEGVKLAGIAEGAEVNYIKSVDENKFTVSSGKLELKTLAVSDVGDLQSLLDNKVDKIEGYTLLSPTDKDKLDALTLADGDISISGSVEATQVTNLDVWITEHRDTVAGLYPAEAADTLSGMVTKVGNLEEELNNYVLKETYDTKIAEIEGILIWQEIGGNN